MLHISHQYQLIAHPPSAPSVVQLCSLQPLGICWNLSIYHSISRINCFTEMLSYRTCVLLTITIALMSSLVSTLKISRLPIRHNFSIKSTEGGSYSSAETVAAMENARTCAANGLSPGAGLATADEQAEAAYADMINTTIDQKGISLSDKELTDLNRGGRMWEKGAITSKNKFGLLSDLSNLWKALSGGAHIEKNEFGET